MEEPRKTLGRKVEEKYMVELENFLPLNWNQFFFKLIKNYI